MTRHPADDMLEASSIIVLPLGATEQHGPHLPAGTDWMIAQGLVETVKLRLPAKLDVTFLPVEKTGYSIEHSDSPATKTFAFDEAVERWIGIAEARFKAGSTKFVMLNAHGGNAPLLTIVATELRARFGMLAVATSWTRFGYPDGLVSNHERLFGIHGGFTETSVMLALHPELVAMDRAASFSSAQAGFVEDFTHLRAYGPHAFGWMMRDLSPTGAVGDAAAATAGAGRLILDHAASGFIALLDDIARFDSAKLLR